MSPITPGGHALGLVFAPPDVRNWAAPFEPLSAPPGNIDLRPRMLAIRNQGSLSSCTGEAGAGCLEMLRGDQVPRSPLYLYYRDRAEDGTLATSDTGATMLGLCKALKDYGIPPEQTWPYDPSRFSVAPPTTADLAAAQCKAAAYYQIKATGAGLLQGVWAALVAQTPVLIALQVYPSLESVGGDGKVPMPQFGETVLGGHAIVAVANYVDGSAPGGGYIGCRNSWGAEYGDNGVAWLPYSYFTSGIVQEGWTVAVAAAPAPEEPTVDVDAIRDRLVAIKAAVGQAQADRCPYSATKAQYQASMATIMDTRIGPIVDLAREVDELLKADPVPVPAPVPAVQFVAPLPNGAVLGRTKWLPGSLGCDLFVKRGTVLVAPADCVVEEVLGGAGMTGGDELILSLPDKSWAWRYRHSRATVRVGDHVKQGQPVATVDDYSLDQLGAIPAWATQQAGGPFADGWQHLDLSVNKGTDRFSATGGRGGNVDAYQWIAGLGYQGRVLQRTPGPPDAGRSLAEAIELMTPSGRR